MATICEFGTAPDQAKDGFEGIGVVEATETEILKMFFADNVRLVKGASLGTNRYEFFVMTRREQNAMATKTDKERIAASP